MTRPLVGYTVAAEDRVPVFEEAMDQMGRISSGGAVLALVCAAILMTSSPASANAIAGEGYSSSYAGESVFTNLGPGESGQLSAIFFNDGTQTWLPGIVGLLVCAADKATCNVPSNGSYNKGWFSQTVYTTVRSPVAPGQNAFFVYEITVPSSTPPGTATSFYGDVGLIATGAMLHPEGYFQTNTTPLALYTLAVSPASASVPVGGFQQFTVAGQPLSATVSWTVLGGCGAINSAGLFVATAMNSASQPCTVVASAAGSSGNASVSVFGQVSQMVCTAAPTSIVADGGATSGGTATVTISLKDPNGNVVLNAGAPQINVTNGTPALASMTPVGAINPAGGVITVTVISTTTPGNVQMSATAPGLAGCSAIIVSGLPGAPTRTVASFSTSPLAADGVSSTTLRIDVLDANGLLAISDNLTQINLIQASGANVCTVMGVPVGSNPISASGSGSATALNGRVAFTIQATSTPGQCAFIVTTNNDTVAGTNATLTTQIVGPANRIAVLSSDSPHPAAGGGSCNVSGFNSDRSCTRIVVGVQDANGLLRTGDNATAVTATRDVSGCTGAGGGDVSNPGTITASGGKITFLFTSGGAYSACRITFSSPGLSNSSAVVAWTPGPPDHLQCAFSPTSIGVNSGAVSIASVTVRDLLGNVAPTGTYSVTLIRTSGASTTLVTQSLAYTSGGFASFTVKPGTTTGTDIWAASLSVGSLPNVAGATPSCVVMVV